MRGPEGAIAHVETMIDTGFNDELTLPPWVIERLQLEFRDEARYTLADGLRAATRIFEGDVVWHGQWRAILIAEIDSDALLGMAMLRGCNLNMDVVDGGRVEIRPLQTIGTPA